ncbi:MAG: pyridoxal phosphate-dependent aminotransferase [Euryarchaeota archaeon]|nr:pyridoxal phosphate-dependent aminotransferase [Euryarchaeota archaeon]
MVSKRLSSIGRSGIREIFQMAGEGAINLGLGELDFDPPFEIKEALKEAVDLGTSKYGPTSGLEELRESIASLARKCIEGIEAKNVLVTAGATGGLLITYQTLLDPEDEVLVPDPGFVVYGPDAVLVGARAVPYVLREENEYLPDVAEMEGLVTPRTKAIVVNSPSNPTGSVFTEEVHKAIIDLAVDRDLWIISDEVYDRFVYGREHRTFCNAHEKSVIVNSFSKSMGVPGWRIGFLIGEEALVEEISKMQYYSLACPSMPIQRAIQSGLPYHEQFVKAILPILDRRRRLIVRLLNDIPGFSCALPRGAFYTFPRFDFNISSRKLAEMILREGVISSPGSAFGMNGEGHIRFSYAASEEDIAKGMETVRSVVSSIR